MMHSYNIFELFFYYLECPPYCLECSNHDGSMTCTKCKAAYALTSMTIATCLGIDFKIYYRFYRLVIIMLSFPCVTNVIITLS